MISQDSVVLEYDGLLVLERRGDGGALVGVDDHAAKIGEKGTIIIEEARVLCRGRQLFSITIRH